MRSHSPARCSLLVAVAWSTPAVVVATSPTPATMPPPPPRGPVETVAPGGYLAAATTTIRARPAARLPTGNAGGGLGTTEITFWRNMSAALGEEVRQAHRCLAQEIRTR